MLYNRTTEIPFPTPFSVIRSPTHIRKALPAVTRAFDVCVDPIETMEQAISLGINTILTSGQRNVCLQGADLLKELVEKSQGRITIQAGSGVGAEVIRQLYPLTGVRAYHMTGKRVIDSEMQFRKDGVNMGLPMLSEYEIWRTDVDNIRAAKKVLEEL